MARKRSSPEKFADIDWDWLTGRIATACGWTLEYIWDHLSHREVTSLFHYWSENPPINESVAQYLGYKKKTITDPKSILMEANASGIRGVTAGKIPDHIKAILNKQNAR